MHSSVEQQSIKTIDFNHCVENANKHITINNDKDYKLDHTSTRRLRKHLAGRAETSLSHHNRPHTRMLYTKTMTRDHFEPTEEHEPLHQINLDQFLDVVVTKKEHEYNDRKNELMKNLNGTWFQTLSHHSYKSIGMCNTLGIKKKKTHSRYHHKQSKSIQSNGLYFPKEYQQQGLFPSRKVTSFKKIMRRTGTGERHFQHSTCQANKQDEGLLKMQLLKQIKPQMNNLSHKSGCSFKTICINSSRRSKTPTVLSNFNNINQSLESQIQPILKGTKVRFYD